MIHFLGGLFSSYKGDVVFTSWLRQVATTRLSGRVEHIAVIGSVNSCVDSLMFKRSLLFLIEEGELRSKLQFPAKVLETITFEITGRTNFGLMQNTTKTTKNT